MCSFDAEIGLNWLYLSLMHFCSMHVRGANSTSPACGHGLQTLRNKIKQKNIGRVPKVNRVASSGESSRSISVYVFSNQPAASAEGTLCCRPPALPSHTTRINPSYPIQCFQLWYLHKRRPARIKVQQPEKYSQILEIVEQIIQIHTVCLMYLNVSLK